MTKINSHAGKDGYRIEVEGHNEKSICGAISTLVAALVGWLENNCPKGYNYVEKDGWCSIETTKKAKDACEMFLIGVLRLEKNFPDKVSVEIGN